MKKYIHLLDGRPAVYVKYEQIEFAESGVHLDDLLVDSLNLIRRQREMSAVWRKHSRLSENDPARFGYLRVKV